MPISFKVLFFTSRKNSAVKMFGRALCCGQFVVLQNGFQQKRFCLIPLSAHKGSVYDNMPSFTCYEVIFID